MYAERNGWVDTGKQIKPGQKCWNCGSTRYHESISLEECPDCGIRCDYWGGGANEKYERASAWKHQAEEALQRRVDEMYGDEEPY